MSNTYKTDLIQQLLDKIDDLTNVVLEQPATINKLTKALTDLTEENASLKEQLNKTSKNSSKPLSSDGLDKPQPKSLRKSSGKKQGVQKGHKGTSFSITKNPDAIVNHIPTRCTGYVLLGTRKKSPDYHFYDCSL